MSDRQRKGVFMPKNRKESFIYTLLMCGVMVFVMSVYNVARIEGISWNIFKEAWIGFPIAYLVAFFCDWFLVATVAKKIAFSIVKPEDTGIKKVIAVSTCMVCGMVVLMSLFGALKGVGISNITMLVWLKNIPLNFIIALPLQLIIAGPLVRVVFRKVFPEGTIVA